MGIFGLIFAFLSFLFKDLTNINSTRKKIVLSELSSFLGKISSDLVLVTYGAISLLYGSLCYYALNNKYTTEEVNLILYAITPLLLIFLLALGFFSYLVRSDVDNKIWLFWKKKMPASFRFLIYLLAPILMSYILWYT